MIRSAIAADGIGHAKRRRRTLPRSRLRTMPVATEGSVRSDRAHRACDMILWSVRCEWSSEAISYPVNSAARPDSLTGPRPPRPLLLRTLKQNRHVKFAVRLAPSETRDALIDTPARSQGKLGSPVSLFPRAGRAANELPDRLASSRAARALISRSRCRTCASWTTSCELRQTSPSTGSSPVFM
jgi:hypothetical protein